MHTNMRLQGALIGVLCTPAVVPGVSAWTLPPPPSHTRPITIMRTTPSTFHSPSSLSATVDDEFMLSSAPFIVGFALVCGIAAQGWINSMAQGERGLGAYLSDGKGFGGSRFSPSSGSGDAVSGEDPLPWLKLPKLDFVDVAGQTDGAEIQLEALRLKMNSALQDGNLERATEIRQELEDIMTANGFDYTPNEWQ